jgi:hypothetical protein
MSKFCFTIMPFAPVFDGVWKNVIRPTVEAFGHRCVRGDDVFAPGSVMEDLFRSIQEADYLVADLTGRNANVFYELGYAHALKKPVVLLTQNVSEVPFDLRIQRFIAYTDSMAGGAALQAALKKFIEKL